MPISGISNQASVIRWLKLRLETKTDQLASLQGKELSIGDPSDH
jgi:hypothetical protein